MDMKYLHDGTRLQTGKTNQNYGQNNCEQMTD